MNDLRCLGLVISKPGNLSVGVNVSDDEPNKRAENE